jgi:MFS transporter, FHS family, glucose/mannose:H+ symporter
MYKKTPVFWGACLGMLLFGICLITLGSVAPDLKRKFLLDGIAAGTLFSILPVGILGGSFVFGPVCDRWGYKWILVLACGAMFAGFQGIAYADTLGLLKVCVFVFGFGGGIINGTTNAVVADISGPHKGANLSLLGVFFGVGALGMPLVLGALNGIASSFAVVAGVGWLTLLVGLLYLFLRFPPAKSSGASNVGKWGSLFQVLLLLMAFFLFFQSSLEAIINNWTTTYLISRGAMAESRALYALSLHIGGMIVMRALTGSVFRQVPGIRILWACLALLLAGIFLMQVGTAVWVIMVGLVLSGAGLAGGFPIILGFAGERFAALSGTAFSFLFVVALIGNMLVNYAMGLIVHHYGVQHLTTVSYIGAVVMASLFYFIVQQLKTHPKY